LYTGYRDKEYFQFVPRSTLNFVNCVLSSIDDGVELRELLYGKDEGLKIRDGGISVIIVDRWLPLEL